MQTFKGDELEIKMIAVGNPIATALSLQKDAMFAGLYSAYPFGDIIYDGALSPLSNAIDRDIFRATFNSIFESFTVAGSFESYLSVFRTIFGENVNVTFTVPAPGKLLIDIEATDVDISGLGARTIVDNDYVLDTVVDFEGDDIISVQTISGFQSQYELEQMLFEMVPAGIYTEISLTLGA